MCLAVNLENGLLHVGLLHGGILHAGILLGVNLRGMGPAAHTGVLGSYRNMFKPEAEYSIFLWQLSRPSYFRSISPSSFGVGAAASAEKSSDGDVVVASKSTTSFG